MTTSTFALPKPRGLSLAAARQFYTSFTPGSGMAAASTERELAGTAEWHAPHLRAARAGRRPARAARAG